jgi:predicted MPP superfamily phosphohydrolase
MTKNLRSISKIITIFVVILLVVYVLLLISNQKLAQNLASKSSLDPKIIAVGDIQCYSSSPHPEKCKSNEEANIATLQKPKAILLLGDEQYRRGTYEDFKKYLDNSWGKLTTIIFPIIGNHDYLTSGASGFYEYFRGKNPAISLDKSYYSFNIGDWHLIALDTNCEQVGGCTPVSNQYKWLEKDLIDNKSKCVLAYFHHPLFSSGNHGNNYVSKSFWDLLYKYHADVVLNGHEHVYERFAPQTPSGKLDTKNGIRQFTVGTGGGPLYKFTNIKPNSEIRNNTAYGILSLTLKSASYSWKFLPLDEGAFTDSGSTSCH